jgi:PRTRC genetic system protein A
MIHHYFVTTPDLPPLSDCAIEYWVGATHTYARAARPGLTVLMPISKHEQPLKGLIDLQPNLNLTPLVPERWLWQMWAQAHQHCPNEVLFHLVLEDGDWNLVMPHQTQSPGHCTPTQTQAESSAQRATIELHSHGHAPAYFSATDDADERSGFRIYGVLGKVREKQFELLLRVGLFGHAWTIPARQVFQFGDDLPDEELSKVMTDIGSRQETLYYGF